MLPLPLSGLLLAIFALLTFSHARALAPVTLKPLPKNPLLFQVSHSLTPRFPRPLLPPGPFALSVGTELPAPSH